MRDPLRCSLGLLTCVVACVGGGGDPGPAGSAAAATGACVAPVAAAHAIPIRFSLPTDGSLAGFTGQAPVTVGVPFPSGEVHEEGFFGVYQQTPAGPCKLPAQFEVTGRWPDDAGVQWLLVDALVDVEAGSVGSTFLQYDDALPAETPDPFPWTTGFAGSIAPDGVVPTTIDPTVLGAFRIRLASGGADLVPEGGVVVETTGPVRTVLAETGSYLRVAPCGLATCPLQRVGQFVTRYTLFRDQPFARIHHTMIWGRDDDGGGHPADEQGFDYDAEDLEYLSYDLPGASSGCGAASIGQQGSAALAVGCAGTVRQSGDDTFASSAAGATAGRLAGWLQIDPTNPEDPDVFVGMRWMAEQWPSGFALDGGAQLRLLDNADLLSWKALATNADTLAAWDAFNADTRLCILPEGCQGATGIAKTYELWLWPSVSTAISPVEKNAFAQGGVLAYADPSFAVRSGIPSPMSACAAGDCTPAAMTLEESVVEHAIADVFTLRTEERRPNPNSPASRLGVLHFGDAFYDPYFYFPGRYWSNAGTGFTSLPWMLWLRSGERRYRDFGEANMRHFMDVDMPHVDRRKSPGSPYQKFRGAEGSYWDQHGALYWGVSQISVPVYVGKTSETEGLVLAYHLTGDRRALDVLRERAAPLAASWDDPGSQLRLALDHIQPGEDYDFTFPDCEAEASAAGFCSPGGDGPQTQYQALEELALLHELFGDEYPNLGLAAAAYLDAVLAIHELGGADDGFYAQPGRKNDLLDGLELAARVFPDQRTTIRDALARYGEYLGSQAVPGVRSGKITGSSQLAALAQYDATGDARVLRQAQSYVYTEALSVQDADGAGEESAWIGASPLPGSQESDVLRDWLRVLARRDDGAVFDPPPAPLAYLSHPSATVAAPGTHDFYALKDAGEDLLVPIDFAYDNINTLRRWIADVETTGPAGNGLAPTTSSYCLQPRVSRFFADVFGWFDESQGTCADPSEAVVYASDPSWRDVGGVFHLRLTVHDETGTQVFAAIPGASALTVREKAGQALSFDGSPDHFVQLARDDRVGGRDAMSLAFRIYTPSDATQVVFGQPYEYSVYTYSGGVYVLYYLTDGAGVVTPSIAIPYPAGWTGLAPFVSTLHVDPDTGDVTVSLCTRGVPCQRAVVSMPGYRIYHPPGDLPLTIGQQFPSGQSFTGQLDDLRVLPRVATPDEIAAYLEGSGRWTVRTDDFADDGEVFLFDGTLRGLSGVARATVHGVEGTDFGYVSDGGTTRVARPARIVERSPSGCFSGQTCAQCASGATGDEWLAYVRSPQGAGTLVARRWWAYPNIYGYLSSEVPIPARIGFLDANGNYDSPSIVDFSDPAWTSHAQLEASEDPSLTSFLVTVYAFWTTGLGPILAHSVDEWFDALACENHPEVATFRAGGTKGYLDLGHVALGDAYTVSFKLRSNGADGVVLNQANELRAQVKNGKVHVDHFVTGQPDPVRVSGQLPADQWVTITSTARFRPGTSTVAVNLYIDGHRVDRVEVAATGFLRPTPGSPLILGRKGPGGAADSFDGLLDDVWVDSGLAAVADLEATWPICQSERPGALLFADFEDCPAGAPGFAVVDRVSGGGACVPGGPICE